jgi:hypothetical protein
VDRENPLLVPVTPQVAAASFKDAFTMRISPTIGLMIRASIVLLAVVCCAPSQTDFGMELLGRVRRHINTGAAGMADFTCQETIERATYSPLKKQEFGERTRLEVLFSGAGELFAWPGSSGFTKEPLEHWIEAGAIGTGSFAAQVHNLFVASAAAVKYAGPEACDERTCYRFDFHAPLLSSRYTLNQAGKSAVVPYSGSFWVDREMLDLVRLETRAEDIPLDLDLREARDSVAYSRVRPDAGERLLPATAELVLVSRSGSESRNLVTFSNCRHYAAESSITFAGTSGPPRPQIQVDQRPLPAGLKLSLLLDQAISTADSAAGDEIVALLEAQVVSGGVPLAKGTRVLGRIRRLEQYLSPIPYYVVGLQFFAAETPAGRIPFNARLTGPLPTPDRVSNPGATPRYEPGAKGLDIEDSGLLTGIGTFLVKDKNLSLPRGFRTQWETQ